MEICSTDRHPSHLFRLVSLPFIPLQSSGHSTHTKYCYIETKERSPIEGGDDGAQVIAILCLMLDSPAALMAFINER